MQASKVHEYQSGAAEYQVALNSARALIDDLTQQLREKENQQKTLESDTERKVSMATFLQSVCFVFVIDEIFLGSLLVHTRSRC